MERVGGSSGDLIMETRNLPSMELLLRYFVPCTYGHVMKIGSGSRIQTGL